MISNKIHLQKFFRGLFFVTTPQNYFSNERKQVSKEGNKAIISKKIIDYVLTQLKDKPNNISFRDSILKRITTKDIHQQIQLKAKDNHEFCTSIGSAELKQAVQEMRKYFIEGVDIDVDLVFQQGRFQEGAKKSEKSMKKKIAFFPTSFTYSKIFSIPDLTSFNSRYLTLGVAGTGKSLALVFLTMISDNINKYLCSGSQQEIEHLRQFDLGTFPKIFYITFNQRTNQEGIVRSLKRQSLEFSQEINQISDLQKMCIKLENLYVKKTGLMPILVIDQINYLMSQHRKSDKKINMNKFVKMLDDIHNLSTKRVYNSSVNIQKDILLQEKFGIEDHTGKLKQLNTSFLPFNQAVKKQLGLYFFFELWQRNILKAKNTESKIIDEILVDILQKNQTVDQLLQYFVKDLGFLPKRVTPLVINQFAKNKQQRRRKSASNKKEIQEIIDQFKIYIKTDTDKKVDNFLNKGSEEVQFSKVNLLEIYLNEAQIIQKIKNKIQKQTSEDQVKILDEQMNQKEKIFNQFRLFSTDKNHFKVQSFDRQLFEVQNQKKNQKDQISSVEIRPTVRYDEFSRITKSSWKNNAYKILMNYSEINPSIFSKAMWEWIEKKNEKGRLFETIIFNVLKNQNTQVSINHNKKIKLNGKDKNKKTIYFKQFYPSFDKKQNSFQESFSQVFDLYEEDNFNKNFFCLPKTQNNPSVDFVIAEYKTQGIIFHMFDATIIVPKLRDYTYKAHKAYNLFHTFTQFKKQSGIEKEDENGFIKTCKINKKEVKYKINHSIIGLFKTYNFYQKGFLKLSLLGELSLQGVDRIGCLSILDFKITNNQTSMQGDIKYFDEVVSNLYLKAAEKYQNVF